MHFVFILRPVIAEKTWEEGWGEGSKASERKKQGFTYFCQGNYKDHTRRKGTQKTTGSLDFYGAMALFPSPGCFLQDFIKSLFHYCRLQHTYQYHQKQKINENLSVNTQLLTGTLTFQSLKQLTSLTQGLGLSLKLTFQDSVNQDSRSSPCRATSSSYCAFLVSTGSTATKAAHCEKKLF